MPRVLSLCEKVPSTLFHVSHPAFSLFDTEMIAFDILFEDRLSQGAMSNYMTKTHQLLQFVVDKIIHLLLSIRDPKESLEALYLECLDPFQFCELGLCLAAVQHD